MPSHSLAINTAWVGAVAIDLLCWTRLLLLDGPSPPQSRP